MTVRSQFQLSSDALREIYDVCEEFENIWKKFNKTKSAPSFGNLVDGFRSNSNDDISQVRQELVRELMNVDLEYRRKNRVAISQSSYLTMLKADLKPVIELYDWSVLETVAGKDAFATEEIGSGDSNGVPVSGESESVDNSLSFLDPPMKAGEIGRIGTDFRLTGILGRGGMGTVFLAEDNLDRKVAVKVIHLRSGVIDAEGQRRFLREAKAMAAIESQHVVPVYQVGQQNGNTFLVMPVLKGETLRERLDRDGALPQDEAIRIAVEVAQGLSDAHAKGQIHRDIKPENIWLENGTGKVKLLDFGLVKIETDTLNTRQGTILGTPQYMAPEQIDGNVERCSDLFSLGVVLYEMLSGLSPFKRPRLAATLLAVKECDCDSLMEKGIQLVPNLANLVDSLISKVPSSRPKSAIDLVESFKALDQPEPYASRGKLPTPQAQFENSQSKFWKRIAAGVAFFAFLILLSIIVFKFKGSHGTILIEVEGQFEISEIELVDQESGKSVQFNQDGLGFTVDTGNYRLKLRTPNGDVVQTNLSNEKLTVYSGKQTKIRAWIAPKSDDAESARKLLKLGKGYIALSLAKPGTPEYEWDDGRSANRATIAMIDSELPTAPFEIVRVSIVDGAEKLPLELYQTIFQLDHLLHVHFNSTMTAEIFSQLPPPPANLRLAKFRQTPLTPDQFSSISDWDSLVCLHFYGVDSFGDSQLAAITKIPELDTLTIDSVAVTEAGLSSIANMRLLTTLQLKNFELSDDGLETLRLAINEIPGVKSKSIRIWENPGSTLTESAKKAAATENRLHSWEFN